MRGAPSPIRGALLGLVIERSGYGYDLARRLEERLGPAWRLSPSGVYSQLDGLAREGLVLAERRPNPQRPRQGPRVWYHATEDAPDWFGDWMRSPLAREPIRPELLARMAVAGPDNVPVVLAALDEYERHCLTLLREAGRSEDDGPPWRTWQAVVDHLVAEQAEQQLRGQLDWVGYARDCIGGFMTRGD